MAKQSAGAAVWWIGPDFRLQSLRISSARLYSGRTYLSEAMNLIPSYLGDLVIVPDGQEPAFERRIDELRQQAAKLRAEAG